MEVRDLIAILKKVDQSKDIYVQTDGIIYDVRDIYESIFSKDIVLVTGE
jgi:hypothetical protein